jgi:hypothetical protein
MIASQASVVAITVMGWAYTKTGSFTSSLVGITALLLISALALFKIRESAIIKQQGKIADSPASGMPYEVSSQTSKQPEETAQ